MPITLVQSVNHHNLKYIPTLGGEMEIPSTGIFDKNVDSHLHLSQEVRGQDGRRVISNNTFVYYVCVRARACVHPVF
jgi:hypothetical protein